MNISESLIKKTALLFGIIIVVIIVLADTRHLGFLYPLYNFPLGDKAGHFILFGLLSLLVNLSNIGAGAFVNPSNQPKAYKLRILITSLILAGFVGIEELSQRWFPSRTFDLVDLSASYLGITLFALLAVKIKTRRSLTQ